MSYSLSDGAVLLGQIASNNGFHRLAAYCASKAYPRLSAWFTTGTTNDVSGCLVELETLSFSSTPAIRSTARGLAKMFKGLKTAVITDGLS
jgi:hypothetical protein